MEMMACRLHSQPSTISLIIQFISSITIYKFHYNFTKVYFNLQVYADVNEMIERISESLAMISTYIEIIGGVPIISIEVEIIGVKDSTLIHLSSQASQVTSNGI